MKESSFTGQGRPLYIIDGYNVIFNREAFFQGRSIEEKRAYFTRLLDAYATKKKVEITVVWDGSGNSYENNTGARRIKNIYSSNYKNADEKIIYLVERMHKRGRIIVVSDDKRHIVGSVKSLGAHAMSVDTFLGMIGFAGQKGKRKKGGGHYPRKDSSYAVDEEKRVFNDLSVEEWLDLFKSKRR